MNQTNEMKNEIDSITLYPNKTFMKFSDTDAGTDYFHTVSFGIEYTLQYIKEKGSDVIRVHFLNNDDEPRYRKRLARIAKSCNYVIEDVSEHKHFETNGVRKEWNEIAFNLIRIGERQ